MGSEALGEQLKAELEAAGRRPCVIPVGGSSAVGTWGYLAAMDEMLGQVGKGAFTDIVMVRGFSPLLQDPKLLVMLPLLPQSMVHDLSCPTETS